MAYRIQGLGWLPDPPDHRDCRIRDKVVAKTVKANVRAMAKKGQAKLFRPDVRSLNRSADLRELCSPVEDQGAIGSCTAQSVCGLVEFLQRGLYGEHLDASRIFLYKATRSFLGWTGDTGAFVRSTIKALKLFGVPPEEYCPYDPSRYDDDLSAFCFAFAANYKAIQYYRLEGLDKLKESLAQGMPFAFGFTCYDSMFTDQSAGTGDIPFPTPDERIQGGHAVMAVGYDDGKGRLIIRNSWGTGWGDGGYGTLPYEFVDQGLATDFWALADMNVERLEEGR
jgi:C1A family cysteine protease